MLLPNQKILDNQINNDDENKKYQCMNCKKILSVDEIEVKVLPDNMTIVGIEGNVPQCPHCGYMHFFGFKDIK